MVKPGEYLLAEGDIEANVGRKTSKLSVSNKGDRPIQVGSHFHFFEVNKALSFERETAYGMHLNIPSGTAVRFEPGQTHEVELVAFAGTGRIHGFNRLVEGELAASKETAMSKLKQFLSNE